ncbi:MAG: MFS transporter, partial [Phycisphaerae bacterium]|nr:MFS transporter [Phycisphaerae bacterium]
ERATGLPLAAGRSIVREGFLRVGRTIRRVGRLPNLMRFLIAFLFYNTGIGTLIIVAAVYAKAELHLTDSTILGCLLMIQFVGVPAAMGFIWIARKLGSRNAIALGIAVYMGVVVYAMQIHTPTEFWILGLLVALVQGGTQAISRSVFGSMIPEGLSAEFYGFFSVYDKVGAFAGPMLFGLFRDLTGSSRSAILFLIAFFGLGLAMLLTVRVAKGIEQAKEFHAEATRT